MSRRHFRFAVAASMLLGTVLLIAGLALWNDGGMRPAWLPRNPTPDPTMPTAFGWTGIADVVAGGRSGSADGRLSQAGFADPFGIATDRDGTVYVADAGDNNRIRKIAPDGNVTTFAGVHEGFVDGPANVAAFNTPSGIAVDRAGNLFVADTGNNAIRKITPQGMVSTIAGNGQAGYRDGAANKAQFNGPVGVAVDDRGNVYVADTYNDRIRLITSTGEVKTLAGGGYPGFADGTSSEARFDTPCGLTVTQKGELMIADTLNNAIRTGRSRCPAAPPDEHRSDARRFPLCH